MSGNNEQNEQNEQDIRSERIKQLKYSLEKDGLRSAARYNYKCMSMEIAEIKQGFAQQVSKLRIEKGISAREMSLSLGQGASYINNIENGRTLPSMAMFFEICDYFGITPSVFFEYADSGSDCDLLLQSFRKLNPSERDALLLLLARGK